jgi:acyl carrier protein
MDEQGLELVKVDEFTMLEVSEDIKGRIRGKEALQADAAVIEEDGEDKQRRFLEHGILPHEGMEVLDRVLGAGVPQVIVSTLDLPPRLKAGARMEKMLKEDEPETGESEQSAVPRPEISSVYVSPKTETEQKIAKVWRRVLGIEQVGMHDDFFELGGDSLNIVQLNNELKQVFKKDIPVAVMFRYQNIHAFTGYLQQENGGQAGKSKTEDRSEEIKKSKDRLKARMRRR